MKKAFKKWGKNLKNIKKKNIAFLTIAGIVNAFGVTVFLAPVSLYDSGISGTSMLLSQFDFLSLSVWLLILNLPLFIFGYKKQGFSFTFYAIYAVLIFSVGAFLFNNVIPLDLSTSSPITGNDLLLCAIFGGLISGAGSGLTIRFGGAIDGIEVLAVIFAKRIGITIGTFVMLYNTLLYIVCGLITLSWVLPLYSIIAYFVGSKTIDYIVDGIDRSKSAMIITNKQEDVCKAISKAFGKGMTIMDAQGFYSKQQKNVIYVVLNRFQIGKMKQIVNKVDPKAFISITDVAEIKN